jgi:L-threonylcarbamoyladenylate synthase
MSALLIYPDGTEARERAAETIAAGGLVAFRTDTFYGLGADPFNIEALEALNELKGREGKPILVLVSDAEIAERLIAHRTRAFDTLAAHNWPGALTLVVAARAELPEPLTAGTGTIGVRLPDDEPAREIVRACGGVLTATSANRSGQPPARTAGEVASYFPRGLGLIIDSGPTRSDLPSTVLDVSGERPRLIREGVVTRNAIEESLKSINSTPA